MAQGSTHGGSATTTGASRIRTATQSVRHDSTYSHQPREPTRMMEAVDRGHSFVAIPPLLYQVAHQLSVNASLPHIFLPSPDLSSVLYWYVTNFTGHWPETPVGVPSVAFVDTPKPIRLQGCITGIIYWFVKYGHPEHYRYLTCINHERHRTFISHAAVMQHVFKAVFASLAMPMVQEYQDYRI